MMRSIMMGLLVCAVLAIAGPSFAEAQGKGKEKAAEQAQEAVNKQTPAAENAADQAAKKAEKAEMKMQKKGQATDSDVVEAAEKISE